MADDPMEDSPPPESRRASRSRSRPTTRSLSPSRSRSPYHSRSRSRSSRSDHSSARSRKRSPSPIKYEAPFLIRIWAKAGPGYHSIQDFEEGIYPLKAEHAVWATKTTTLPQITSSLLPSLPILHRSPAARYTYRMLYTDMSQKGQLRGRNGQGPGGRGYSGLWRQKEMGPSILGRDLHENKDGKYGVRTLDELRFQPGDMLLLSISLPPAAPLGVPLTANNLARPVIGNPPGNAYPTRNPGFSVFGASSRGGSMMGGGPRGGPGPSGNGVMAGGVGAPADGSWQEAREANPGFQSRYAVLNGADQRDAPRGEGGWRGRAMPSGAQAGRARGDERRRDASGERDRSRSPVLRSRGARRPSPQYN